MSEDRKKAYEAIYASAANPHEIRVWWDQKNGWQASAGNAIPESAREILKALLAELSR